MTSWRRLAKSNRPLTPTTPKLWQAAGMASKASVAQLDLYVDQVEPDSTQMPAALGSAVCDTAADETATPYSPDVLVRAFHCAFGLPVGQRPDLHQAGPRLRSLRVDLLREEVDEFEHAIKECDLVAVADALADIVYVAYGAAISFGIDLDAVIAEVHRANMSKLDKDGLPLLRHDGKVLKSDGYRPPDVAAVLRTQT